MRRLYHRNLKIIYNNAILKDYCSLDGAVIKSVEDITDPDSKEFKVFKYHSTRSYVLSWMKSHVTFSSPEVETQMIMKIVAHDKLNDTVNKLFMGEDYTVTHFPKDFITALASEFEEGQIMIDGDTLDVAKLRSTSLEKLPSEGPLDTKSSP